ncbi:glycerophosphodiester phosphodiesterase family protein [Sphingomonas sp.]|uniref:glycerophosphodiester phosphodiesterase n=1 Tax=Sphingomonas sp. TaxID=28214 RepID=UPI0025CC7DCF|nr:glycerophosphodiester phosphodiesterase family protein [Sphingomonas sp.]
MSLTHFLAFVAAATPAAPPQPLTIGAHRGLAEGVPENTLAAFRHSLAAGIKVIELDLRTTRDGQLVVMHDATLNRTTDCSGAVAEQTLARIQQCDAGWPTHVGERVPTLGDVLALVTDADTRLLLDCKSVGIDQVLRQVRAHHAEGKVIFGLRRPGDIAHARAALPGVTIIAFMPERADAPMFVDAGADIVRLWSDWVEADPALVARTQALGKPVWIMVGRKLPRSNADWQALHGRMIAAGADGLVTNRPELVSAE